MNLKEQFLGAWFREFPITLNVLNAYPQDRGDFRPHEKSSDAKTLAWNFVLGQVSVQQALDGTFTLPPNFPSAPATWQDLIQAYQTEQKKLISRMETVRDSDLENSMKFLVAKNEMKDIPKIDFLWFVFSDQIHHRGQLSVYLRLAGGKVPSIYGPSADEPWF